MARTEAARTATHQPIWLGVDAPSARGAAFPWGAYGWAFGFVLVCTLIDKALVGRIAESNLTMLYLVGVLLVALRGDLGAALVAAVLAVLMYDFFFVPPFLSFAVSDTQYLFTFLVMGAVALVISTLTARLAAEIASSWYRERQARALYELSHSLLAARRALDMVEEGARVISLELGAPVAAWLKDAAGQAVTVAEPLVPLSQSEQEILRWVFQYGRAAGPGTDKLPGSSYLFLPIRSAEHAYGALALRSPQGEPALSLEVRHAVETGANQLAVALDQARVREEAASALRQAESERLRNALLSSVSHDLRTPLTGIVGSASSLVDGAEALDADTRRELAQGIVEESERLSRLVTNLLHATRLDSGAVKLARDWFPIEELLGPTLARLHDLLCDHPVTLEVPADLPMVSGDAALLEQVFLNLLENAAKYTPPGTPITIRAAYEAPWLRVEVADQGPGLPCGEEERVFEKFRRYASPGAIAGAGLGLAICRGIVVAHGGMMRSQAVAGGGACFHFSLPLTEAPGLGAPAPTLG